MRAPNWRRGLLRLWLVLAVLWIVAVGWIMRPDKDARAYWVAYSHQQEFVEAGVEPQSERCKREDGSLDAGCVNSEWQRAQGNRDKMNEAVMQKRERVKALKFSGLIILGPIVAALILGFVFGWVGKGFLSGD